MEAETNFEIHARDGTAMIVLRRNTRQGAQKKAEELRDMGWFEVEIVELSGNRARFDAAAASRRSPQL